MDETQKRYRSIYYRESLFVLSKENKHKFKSSLLLDIDIDTQPDIVLIMEVNNDETIHFETTEYTRRILKD